MGPHSLQVRHRSDVVRRSGSDAGLGSMTNTRKRDEQVGWELIWRSGDDHPRYGSFAAPDAAVVEWAETIPSQGNVLDLGCGVGRHMVYLGERGFRMAGVDISPTGIERARKACADRQIAFQGH